MKLILMYFYRKAKTFDKSLDRGVLVKVNKEKLK